MRGSLVYVIAVTCVVACGGKKKNVSAGQPDAGSAGGTATGGSGGVGASAGAAGAAGTAGSSGGQAGVGGLGGSGGVCLAPQARFAGQLTIGCGCDSTDDCDSGELCCEGSCVAGLDSSEIGCARDEDCEEHAQSDEDFACIDCRCEFEELEEEDEEDDNDAVMLSDFARIGRSAGQWVLGTPALAFNVIAADQPTLSSFTILAPDSELFEGVNPDFQSHPGPVITLSTSQQTITATFNPTLRKYEYSGFNASVSAFASVDALTATAALPTGDASVRVDAPPPIINPADLIGDPNGLATELRGRPDDFDALVVNIQLAGSSLPGLAGITRVVLASELAPNGPYLTMPLLDAASIDAINSRGLTPTNVIFGHFRKQSTSELFPGVNRPVPVFAGRLYEVDDLAALGIGSPPSNPCASVPTGQRCSGGPNRRLLVTNGNGSIRIIDPADGSDLGDFFSTPNFAVLTGQHTIQGPDNCLYMSDSGNEQVVVYDTDARYVEDLIESTTPAGTVPFAEPHGMAFHQGDLYVATRSPSSRVLRFTAAGAFVSEVVSDGGDYYDVELLVDGRLLVSDAGGTTGMDTVRLYPAGGGAGVDLLTNLSTPEQIISLDGASFTVATFGTSEAITFDDTGMVQRRVVASTTQSIRAAYPLDNGRLLVTGNDSAGIGTVDPTNPGTIDTTVAGSTWRFIGEACMP